jgi:hypothetical protein
MRRHEYTVKRLWPCVDVVLRARVPGLGMEQANGADVDASADVEKGVIMGRW